MHLHECQCGWTWVIGKKKVVGPFYNGSVPHVMSRQEWNDAYGDCTRVWERTPV